MRFATSCHGALTQNHALVYSFGNRAGCGNCFDFKWLLPPSSPKKSHRQPAITANDDAIEYWPHHHEGKKICSHLNGVQFA